MPLPAGEQQISQSREWGRKLVNPIIDKRKMDRLSYLVGRWKEIRTNPEHRRQFLRELPETGFRKLAETGEITADDKIDYLMLKMGYDV